MKKLSTYLIPIFILYSCEGFFGGNGKILSDKTNEPIENVTVKLYLNNKLDETSNTTRNGSFKAVKFVGGWFSPPSVKLIFSKTGYDSLAIDFNQYWKTHDIHKSDSLIFYLTEIK